MSEDPPKYGPASPKHLKLVWPKKHSLSSEQEEILSSFLENMASDELNKAIEEILKGTDRETQIKVLRALMKYQNIDGLNLEEALSDELDL